MGLFSWLLAPVIDKRIAAFQRDLMGKHITEVENIYRQMRGWDKVKYMTRKLLYSSLHFTDCL